MNSPNKIAAEIELREHNEAIQTVLEKAKPQLRTLVKHLQTYRGGISHFEAMLHYGVAALPKRITELEEYGVRIERARKVDPTGQRYMRYFLKTWEPG